MYQDLWKITLSFANLVKHLHIKHLLFCRHAWPNVGYSHGVLLEIETGGVNNTFLATDVVSQAVMRSDETR